MRIGVRTPGPAQPNTVPASTGLPPSHLPEFVPPHISLLSVLIGASAFPDNVLGVLCVPQGSCFTLGAKD